MKAFGFHFAPLRAAGQRFARRASGDGVALARAEQTRAQAILNMMSVAQEMELLSHAMVENSMAGAQRSNAQRERVLEVIKLEERIQVAASTNGRDSRSTAERTMEVSRATDLANETLHETTRTIGETGEAVSASATLMREFVEQMEEVRRIVETIRQIARQTNLLALNAAIEAAHAGKEGDGFNVIAQEVRQLADQASDSTTEIEEKIDRMGASARVAEAAMLTGQATAETSVRQTLEIQRSFGKIRDAIHEVQSMSAGVAAASDKQIAAGERVAAGVIEIDGLAAECAQDSDASAERSIRLVACVAQFSHTIGWLHPRAAGKAGKDHEKKGQLLARLKDHEEDVKRAMQMLRRLCAEAGAASARGSVELQGRTLPGLYFGSIAAVEMAGLVDAVSERTGCGATMFVADKESFIRVATNVKRADGQRATGTALNPKGLALPRLLAAKSHYGAVYVLGKPFLAAYEPLLSSSGTVIGALYVGHALEEGGGRSR